MLGQYQAYEEYHGQTTSTTKLTTCFGKWSNIKLVKSRQNLQINMTLQQNILDLLIKKINNTLIMMF